ncbi:hypothetical protein Tco_0018055 [Tanacetum coccineum]
MMLILLDQQQQAYGRFDPHDLKVTPTKPGRKEKDADMSPPLYCKLFIQAKLKMEVEFRDTILAHHDP